MTFSVTVLVAENGSGLGMRPHKCWAVNWLSNPTRINLRATPGHVKSFLNYRYSLTLVFKMTLTNILYVLNFSWWGFLSKCTFPTSLYETPLSFLFLFHIGPHGVANAEVRQTGHMGGGHYSEVVLRLEGPEGSARNEVPAEGGVSSDRHPEVFQGLEGTQGAAGDEVSPESGGFSHCHPEILPRVEGTIAIQWNPSNVDTLGT